MSDEWGPWIEHDGRGCPLPAGVFCRTLHKDGETLDSPSTGSLWSGWSWMVCEITGHPHMAIIRYRIRRPRALMQMIERAESLPVKRKVDA